MGQPLFPQGDDFGTRFRNVLLFQRLRRPLALLTLALAVIGLLGSYVGLNALIGRDPNAAMTHPATAFCMMVVALGLYRYRIYHAPARLQRVLSSMTLTFLLTVIGLRALRYFFDLPISMRFIENNLGLGALGTDTALVLALLFMSALVRRRSAKLGLTFAVSAVVIILFAFVGLSFGKRLMEGQMAVTTLIGLVPASLGILSIFAHNRLLRVLLLSDPVGLRTRMMLATGFFVPWTGGLFLHHGVGVPDRAVPVESLLVSVTILSMAAVAVASGYNHEKSDQVRRRLSRALARMAVEDNLTGTLNRAGLMIELRNRWEHFQATGRNECVIILDLDHFKQINDQYGHDEGDRVLAAVGDILSPNLRRSDKIGRWGGEEFLILVSGLDRGSAVDLTERLRSAIARLPTFLARTASGDAAVYDVTGSFGVSFIEEGDMSASDAIKRADVALYSAKNAGRNQVAFRAKAAA